MKLKIIDIPVKNYERVIHVTHETTKLDCIIAIHNTNLGPALGGVRSWIYKNFDEQLNDEVVGEPELYIWVEKTKQPIYHLAWLTELFVHSTDPDDELPIHRWKIFVDAHSGNILEKFD